MKKSSLRMIGGRVKCLIWVGFHFGSPEQEFSLLLSRGLLRFLLPVDPRRLPSLEGPDCPGSS